MITGPAVMMARLLLTTIPTAVNGGAIDVRGNSQVIWSGRTTFTSNRFAQSFNRFLEVLNNLYEVTAGGAVYSFRNCTANFIGKTTFDANAASIFQGGALCSLFSKVYFWDKTTFICGQNDYNNRWSSGGYSGDISFRPWSIVRPSRVYCLRGQH